MPWFHQQNRCGTFIRPQWWLSLGCVVGVLLSLGKVGWATEPQLDQEKPPLNTGVERTAPSSGVPPLHAQAERQGQSPASPAQQPAHQKTLVLTGKVQTLQEAIDSERGTVDWYAWYLAARQYLGQTGGIHCTLGTPIKFYRDGLIEALSFDSACMASVMGRRFPLPVNTKLDALILPVRPGAGPPATRQEIYSRVQSGKSH